MTNINEVCKPALLRRTLTYQELIRWNGVLSQRATIGLWLMACCQALGQNASDLVRQRPPDVTIYQSFFWRVSVSTAGDTLYPSSPGEPLVLTEYENQALRIVAAACQSKLQSLWTSIKSARMEILFQTIESGQPSEQHTRQLAELQAQEPQIVQEHFQALKSVFGDTRFQRVQEVLRQWNPELGSPLAKPIPRPQATAQKGPHNRQ